jgi:DNA-directed RNA polymerase specialized sigma24 family protein
LPSRYHWSSDLEKIKSLKDVRSYYRWVLFREWDNERIEALGGISDTVRYNARQDLWEEKQTFHETMTMIPKSAQRLLKRAVAARRQAAEAALKAAQATRAAAQAMASELGMSYAEIGKQLGVSKMRVCQILTEMPSPGEGGAGSVST